MAQESQEPSFHYSILERLGIGWRDSVCQSNEKRVKEYDRQLEEALEHLGTSREHGVALMLPPHLPKQSSTEEASTGSRRQGAPRSASLHRNRHELQVYLH